MPIPKRLRKSLLIDFIIKLLPLKLYKKEFDLILVTINYYIKIAYYLPTIIIINTEELADLFIENILTKYNTLKLIILDRGSLFTSQFWSELYKKLRIKRGLSMAFHPQTNGQTKRQNQTLKQYLRAFINYQ